VEYGFNTAHRLLAILALVAALFVPAVSRATAAGDECPSGWVALTFDDGPTVGRSEAILEVLDEHGTSATFFSIGKRVALNPELAIAMVRAGHVVANHTWAHVDLTELSLDDVLSSVRRTDVAFHAIGIEPLRLVRPPFLRTNRAIHDALDAAGFVPILETLNPRDWQSITPKAIAERVISKAVDGSIIGLHDGSGRYAQTAIATGVIVDTLTDEEFCFGVLDARGDIIPPSIPDAASGSLPAVSVDEMIWIKYLMGV